MAFRLVNYGAAVDDERGVEIRTSPHYRDITNELPFYYIKGDLKFEFFTLEKMGIPVGGVLGTGETEPTARALALSVSEESVIAGLQRALGPDALQVIGLDQLKSEIKEALFLIGSRGGNYLKYSPDYFVEFSE